MPKAESSLYWSCIDVIVSMGTFFSPFNFKGRPNKNSRPSRCTPVLTVVATERKTTIKRQTHLFLRFAHECLSWCVQRRTLNSVPAESSLCAAFNSPAGIQPAPPDTWTSAASTWSRRWFVCLPTITGVPGRNKMAPWLARKRADWAGYGRRKDTCGASLTALRCSPTFTPYCVSY